MSCACCRTGQREGSAPTHTRTHPTHRPTDLHRPPSTHHTITKHTEEVAGRLDVGLLHGPRLVLCLGAPRRLVPPVEQARELQQVFLWGRVDRWGGRSAHDTDNVMPQNRSQTQLLTDPFFLSTTNDGSQPNFSSPPSYSYVRLGLNPPPIPSFLSTTTDHNRPLIPSSLSTTNNNAAYLDLQRLAGLAEAE